MKIQVSLGMTTAKGNLVGKSEDSLHAISETFFDLILGGIAPEKKHTEKK